MQRKSHKIENQINQQLKSKHHKYLEYVNKDDKYSLLQ